MCIGVQVHMCHGRGQLSEAGFPMMSPKSRTQVLRPEFKYLAKYFDLLSCPACPLSSFSQAHRVLTLTLIYIGKHGCFIQQLTRLFGQNHSYRLTCGLILWKCSVYGWHHDSQCVWQPMMELPMTSQSCNGLSFDSPHNSGKCVFSAHLDFELEN